MCDAGWVARFRRGGSVAAARGEPRSVRGSAPAHNEDGGFDELLQLIGEVRRAASKAGYYHMCVPEHLGGGGMGHLAYFVGWEELFRVCGPQNWLMLYAVSHWAFGPSRMLEKVTEEARAEMLAPMMAGEKSMCFGLSEPGAGSDASQIKTRAVPDGMDGGSVGARFGRRIPRWRITASSLR